mgnify:CR=1 FL=1
MKKHIILICIFLVCINNLIAQTDTYYRNGHEIIPYRLDNLWGYKNSSDDSIIIKAQFDDADLFSANGLARVSMKGKFGFINRKGKLIIPCVWDNAEVFYYYQTNCPTDYVNVYNKKEAQYLNRNGKRLSGEPEPNEETPYFLPNASQTSCFEAPYYNFIYTLDSVRNIFVKRNVINKIVVNDFIDYAPYTKEIIVKKGEKFGVIDILGDTILPFSYDSIYKDYKFSKILYTQHNGYFVMQNTLVGYIDLEKHIIIPVKYKSILRIDLNIIEVITRTGKKGFVDFRRRKEYFDE